MVDTALYQVDDQFPQIVPGTFGGAAPAGVTHIEYDISMDGFQETAVSHSPTPEIAKIIVEGSGRCTPGGR